MIEKERKKLLLQFSRELAEICKEDSAFERVGYLASVGADIFIDGLRPLSNAVKNKCFNVINVLIDCGILRDERAKRVIGSMCDYKSFLGSDEEKYFALLERAISITGESLDYFVSYINSMLAHGKVDKLFEFIHRFNISEEEAAKTVFPRIIFEVINNGFHSSLDFINSHVDWMNLNNLNIAVSSKEKRVVQYLYENATLPLPSEQAILSAIYEGELEILNTLLQNGWNCSSNPLYLKKACQAFKRSGKASLEFLLENGYSLLDIYDNKTILENAVLDDNKQLLDFLREKIGS